VATGITPDELRRRRQALGLSPTALARALGVHRASIYHWETGEGKPPKMLALAIERLESLRRQ